jgi:hypothetical protein
MIEMANSKKEKLKEIPKEHVRQFVQHATSLS